MIRRGALETGSRGTGFTQTWSFVVDRSLPETAFQT
jgi:hypothetical protein